VIGPQQLMLAVLAAGGAFLGGFLYGHSDGRQDERLEWEERENSALREANAALDAAHRKAREQEQRRAAVQAQLVADFEEELHHAETARDRAIAAVRRGELRLRDTAAAAGPACGGGAAEVAASATPGVPAPAPSELPRARDEAVVRLLAEADELVGEVNLCWSIVRKDREQ
jgi:Rz lysis protein